MIYSINSIHSIYSEGADDLPLDLQGQQHRRARDQALPSPRCLTVCGSGTVVV
jgi:hypothetical protein